MNKAEEARNLGKEGEALLSELFTYQLTKEEYDFCNAYLMEMAKGLINLDVSTKESDKQISQYLKKTEVFNREIQKLLEKKKAEK